MWVKPCERNLSQVALTLHTTNEPIVTIIINVLKRSIAILTQRLRIFGRCKLAITIAIGPNKTTKPERLVWRPYLCRVAGRNHCTRNSCFITILKTKHTHWRTMLSGGDEKLFPLPAPNSINKCISISTSIIREASAIQCACDPLLISVVIEGGKQINFGIRVCINSVKK